MTELITNNKLLTEATIEKLLRGRLFMLIEGQLLYYSEKFQTYVITEISADKDFTVDDYMELPENAPFQLINSKLIYMAAPKLIHQEILLNLATELKIYNRNNELGKIYLAPTDVQFDEENMFQPDLIFVSIARKNILENEKNVQGAPDFVVEILSKGTEDKDRNEKMTTYGQYEVIEYWIVNPEAENIEVYHNENREMVLVQTAEKTDEISSKAIEGFVMKVESVFG